jgi:hypothetical protein
MPTFLIRRPAGRNSELSNSNGIAAVLVNGANESAARAAARSSAPNGETRIFDGWTATQIQANDATVSPIFFEGQAVLPSERLRGG